MNHHVLVTCGGKWVGVVLQLQQALRELHVTRHARVLVADHSRLTPAGCFADKSVVAPSVNEPNYIDALLEICQREKIGVLLPLIDLDLVRLAPHQDRFRRMGTQLISPAADLVELCFDKVQFATFASQHDIPIPRRLTLDELPAANYPLFYKPRCGFGSQGTGVCSSPERATQIAGETEDTIFEEFIDAPELSVDAYVAAEGHCTVRVQRVRDKIVGGEVVQSHTVQIPAVREVAKKTIDALGACRFHGPLNVQLFASDPPVVIEVNPRLGSGAVLSNVASHGRLYKAILSEALGHAIDGDPDQYEVNLSLCRYLGDVIHKGGQPHEIFPEKSAA